MTWQMASVPITYRYPFASGLHSSGSPVLGVSTCNRQGDHPYLFEGTVLNPSAFAHKLSLLSRIVRTHFFLQLDPKYLDPVVTVDPKMIRMEGFSACCGVYARADLPIQSFVGEVVSSGTTNVDFGTPMRVALARITDHETLTFRVGKEQVELETLNENLIERKVPLPVRWVKSFTEVQVLQKNLRDKFKIGRAEATRFLKSLPKGKSPKQTMYAVPSGKGIRLTTRSSKDAVGFSGVHRVRVLESLISRCDFLRVWSDPDSGISGWEIQSAAGRMFVLLSPRPYRGFSGEGQNLTSLALEPWEFTTSGFDVVQQNEFERELPLNLSGIKRLQPRLKNATNLLESGSVKIAKTLSDGEFDVLVASKSTEHYVRLRNDGDACTCRWFSRYQGQRGPCKHVLAARMLAEVDSK